MLERLRTLVTQVRSSLWFVPSLTVALCVGAAIGLVEVDVALSDELLSRWPRLFGAGAEGTREMLATIAGSMITVAGVVFSITIVALSLTSTQYSPRVLRNFLDDRTNQLVLGVFVGVFAYCLVVLRTVRGVDEGNFVPSIAVLVAVLLAFLGIFVLILFIHHVATSIQASHILANVARDTAAAIDDLFPERLGEGPEAPAPIGADDGASDRWQAVASEHSGYVQRVDAKRLMSLACEYRTVIWLQPSPGDFVVEGVPLFLVASQGQLAADLAAALRDLVIVGRARTLDQDAAFGLRQIVDVALKALSPGVNDMTTAVTCIDHLGALCVRIATRRFESPYRYADGVLRVIAHGPTFASLVETPLEEVRLAAREQPPVLQRLVALMAVVGRATIARDRRDCLLDRAYALMESARRIADPPQRKRIIAAVQALIVELRLDHRSQAMAASQGHAAHTVPTAGDGCGAP